jgi:hypothetical protein
MIGIVATTVANYWPSYNECMTPHPDDGGIVNYFDLDRVRLSILLEGRL